jgi:uncharacterized membrane protein YgdD (TMEM256/DUF423 family)
MTDRTLVFAGALNMFIAVGAGAFGSHGLKQMLTPDMLAIWHTAVTYQMAHALGLLLIGLLLRSGFAPMLKTAGWLMLAGIVLFSGSLYVLAFTGVRVLGAITPIGGLGFLAAWAMVAWVAMRR